MEPVDKKEMVKCLGWCGGEFASPDRTKIRFCKKCTAKKEQQERTVSKIRSFGDGMGHSFHAEG